MVSVWDCAVVSVWDRGYGFSLGLRLWFQSGTVLWFQSGTEAASATCMVFTDLCFNGVVVPGEGVEGTRLLPAVQVRLVTG